MSENEWIAISGLQHFEFCRRQWALIHLEQQWADNAHTADGEIFHHRTHDDTQTEMRGSILITRGFRVQSERLGLSGICDVLEFHQDSSGITLYGRQGLWLPYPVEYKKGEPKPGIEDKLQVCAQAMCLEDMFACVIPEGSLYYGETRHRERVQFDTALRARVLAITEEMNDYLKRGHTPTAKVTKACNACSLKELCIPRLKKSGPVSEYIHSRTTDDI